MGLFEMKFLTRIFHKLIIDKIDISDFVFVNYHNAELDGTGIEQAGAELAVADGCFIECSSELGGIETALYFYAVNLKYYHSTVSLACTFRIANWYSYRFYN